MILGLLLALASALATNVAFLLKYRGAIRVAPIRARHPLRSAAALFRSRWFAIGWLVAIVAWVDAGNGSVSRSRPPGWP